MWEPDFSYLGKRNPEEREESEEESTDTGEIPWWNREDAFGRNAHLRDLILSNGAVSSNVVHKNSNVFASPLPTCSSIPPSFALPPKLTEPRVRFAATDEVVCIPNKTEDRCDEPQLPIAEPDPSWGPFEHAGLLREIGGIVGWRKVFVDKTHRLPPGW